MTITTPRLALREMTQDDFAALAAILTDAETMQYYPRLCDDIRVAFGQFGFPAVYSYMHADNEPSWRTAVKTGMTLQGEYEDPHHGICACTA